MPLYGYECPSCGPVTVDFPVPSVQCRCGRIAKRQWQVSFDRSSTKPYGHRDPVVGAYVSSKGEFDSLLSQGVDREAEKLQMDVKVATCDARDTDALAELHDTTPEQRASDIEP